MRVCVCTGTYVWDACVRACKGMNNVFGKVPTPKASTHTVKFLGTFPSKEQCFSACNATKGCADWTFHSPAFPDKNFAGGCYYTTGGAWGQ